MENYSIRPFFVCAVLVAATTVAVAQQSQYEGVSTPPADDPIVSTVEQAPVAKPHPGVPAYTAPSSVSTPSVNVQMQAPAMSQPAVSYPVRPAQPSNGQYAIGTDDEIVGVGQDAQQPAYGQQPAYAQPSNTGQPVYGQPALQYRNNAPSYSNVSSDDPDGDIVHPRPVGPNELVEGTIIRVTLIDWLSSGQTQKGEPFRSRVAADVYQGGRVLIPAGTEIDGHVTEASSGHFAGHGTLRLHPETILMPDGSSYQLSAQVAETQGSNTRVGNEGTIAPTPRIRRGAIEYGGGVGVGLIAGAALGGPVGAVTGGAIGAGLVTVHLLTSHAQAKLEPGSSMSLYLTEPLQVVPAGRLGN